jgi:hypothetical protein
MDQSYTHQVQHNAINDVKSSLVGQKWTRTRWEDVYLKTRAGHRTFFLFIRLCHLKGEQPVRLADIHDNRFGVTVFVTPDYRCRLLSR